MSTIGGHDPELPSGGRVAVIVAHPDDETLWAGGLLLSHPEWSPFIVTLCRGKDPDRAPKFRKVLDRLGASGAMGDLDDGPGQTPISEKAVAESLLDLFSERDYDLLLTHSPSGEYTRHRRHEEVARAVWSLWRGGVLRARSLWQFAYEDGGGAYPPRPKRDASFHVPLPDSVYTRKYRLITEVYGFDDASWEAKAVSRTEAFNFFHEPEKLIGPVPMGG